MKQSGLSAALLALSLLAAAGCRSDAKRAPDLACEPSCAARACGDDGCGGSCGSCPGGESCSPAGLCEAIDTCTDSCAGLGFECGEVCGESCGSCSGEQMGCVQGHCQCIPACDGRACTEPDGCGSTCGPCAVDLSCEDCPLRLQVVDLVADATGTITEIVLGLDFNPLEDMVLPGLGDIRIAADKPVDIVGVELGEAAIAAQKDLRHFTLNDRPWRLLEDGAFQMMLLSTANTERLGAGRWLTIRVKPLYGDEAVRRPVSLWLVKREQTLAPRGADEALQDTAYNAAVVAPPHLSQLPDAEVNDGQ